MKKDTEQIMKLVILDGSFDKALQYEAANLEDALQKLAQYADEHDLRYSETEFARLTEDDLKTKALYNLFTVDEDRFRHYKGTAILYK